MYRVSLVSPRCDEEGPYLFMKAPANATGAKRSDVSHVEGTYENQTYCTELFREKGQSGFIVCRASALTDGRNDEGQAPVSNNSDDW